MGMKLSKVFNGIHKGYLYLCLANAIGWNAPERAEKLLDKGAPVLYSDLKYSIQDHKTAIVALLLKKSVNRADLVNKLKKDRQIIFYACRDSRMIRILLDHGVDPNTKNFEDETLLVHAGNQEVEQLLLERGATQLPKGIIPIYKRRQKARDNPSDDSCINRSASTPSTNSSSSSADTGYSPSTHCTPLF